MILIADYGIGNVGSIANMIRKIGGKAEVSAIPERIAEAEKLILPGVGAFDHGMRSLQKANLIKPLTIAALERKVPILGICLGMQLMLDGSEEGIELGLGWINGRVTRLKSETHALKIPHMGWNVAQTVKQNPLLPAQDTPQRFYFVHSYKVECANISDEMASTNYGAPFCSAFMRANIFGVQFHPEKSHAFGMALFRRFVEL